MSDIYDWEKEDAVMLRRFTSDPDRKTRVGCKSCGGIFVRPYREYGFDVVFIQECPQHEGWEREMVTSV